MAETGRPGGRQGLENTRVRGPIHAAPPEVRSASEHSIEANAVHHPTKTITRNAGGGPAKPPRIHKEA